MEFFLKNITVVLKVRAPQTWCFNVTVDLHWYDKFVKNQFRVSDTIGNYLDAYYYLTPLPKKSIRLEALAKTNSANYTGTELNLNWSNRNTFRGAELLKISAS